jgi:hypothetical protein
MVVLTAVVCVLLGAAGCGEGKGVSAGATVVAYVEAPLCAGAKRELASEGGRAGDLRVRAVCLAGVDGGGHTDLVQLGANARRATEDSASVGYIEPPATPSFSRPIVEAAGIAVVRSNSGQVAMKRLLGAIGGAGDSGSLRASVRDALG